MDSDVQVIEKQIGKENEVFNEEIDENTRNYTQNSELETGRSTSK